MRIDLSLLSIILTFSLFASSCSEAQTNNDSSKGVVKDISVIEAYEMLETDDELYVLDVRTDAECAKGKLPGATQIDYYRSDFLKQTDKLDKEQALLVYCAVGGRSGDAVKQLKKQGFKKVYNVKGGINAWNANQLPIIKE